MSKSKGLWLGSWAGRSDLPVSLDWSLLKSKVLRVFVGPGNFDEDNRRPCITAVANTLSSWHQRILSFQGRALVIDALASSRLWCGLSRPDAPLGSSGTGVARFQASFGRIRRSLLLGQLLSRLLRWVVSLRWTLS